MIKNLITKSELARICGVSPTAVTRATKRALSPAIVGRRVDRDHIRVQEYIAIHTGKETPKRAISGRQAVRENKKKASTISKKEEATIPGNLDGYADMSLRQLIKKYGTDMAFVDWLKAYKEIEAINEKQLKIATIKGELVSRDLVEKNVISQFNAAHLRLMTDGAKSIASGLVAKHVSGAESHELEAHVVDVISSMIKPLKNKIKRGLNGP